jgi:SNF2 family DNA or RNA helicase
VKHPRTEALQSLIKPFILRREKEMVIPNLPVKRDVVLVTGISDVQKKLYKALLTKNMAAFENQSKIRLNNVLMQLRKCVNHPYLFPGVEPEPFAIGEHLVDASGKLWLLDRLLKHLKQHGHRVLLFSQMTSMLDIIQDYLDYRGYSYERVGKYG